MALSLNIILAAKVFIQVLKECHCKMHRKLFVLGCYMLQQFLVFIILNLKQVTDIGALLTVACLTDTI